MGQIAELMKLVQSFVDLKSMVNASAIEIDPSPPNSPPGFGLLLWKPLCRIQPQHFVPDLAQRLMTPMWWRWAQPLRLSSRSV